MNNRKNSFVIFLLLMMLFSLAGCGGISNDRFFYVNQDPAWMAYVNTEVPHLASRYEASDEDIETYISCVEARLEVHRKYWEERVVGKNVFWTDEENRYVFGEFFTAYHWTGDYFASQIEGRRNVFYPVIFKDNDGIFILGISDDGEVRSFWKEGDRIAEFDWERQIHYREDSDDVIYSTAEHLMTYNKVSGVLTIWQLGEECSKLLLDSYLTVDNELVEGENGEKYLNFFYENGELFCQLEVYPYRFMYPWVMNKGE